MFCWSVRGTGGESGCGLRAFNCCCFRAHPPVGDADGRAGHDTLTKPRNNHTTNTPQCYESISNNVGAEKGLIPDWMTPAGTFYNQVRTYRYICVCTGIYLCMYVRVLWMDCLTPRLAQLVYVMYVSHVYTQARPVSSPSPTHTLICVCIHYIYTSRSHTPCIHLPTIYK